MWVRFEMWAVVWITNQTLVTVLYCRIWQPSAHLNCHSFLSNLTHQLDWQSKPCTVTQWLPIKTLSGDWTKAKQEWMFLQQTTKRCSLCMEEAQATKLEKREVGAHPRVKFLTFTASRLESWMLKIKPGCCHVWRTRFSTHKKCACDLFGIGMKLEWHPPCGVLRVLPTEDLLEIEFSNKLVYIALCKLQTSLCMFMTRIPSLNIQSEFAGIEQWLSLVPQQCLHRSGTHYLRTICCPAGCFPLGLQAFWRPLMDVRHS